MKNHKGFTIVELLIGMTILSIVAVALTGFIVSSSKSYAASNTEIIIQQESQLAMNQISDVIIDTTRSVNYVGYSLDGSDSEQVVKDADFTIDVEDKCLVVYNGEVEYEVDENGEFVLDGDDNLVIATEEDGSPKIDEGNGNKNYQIYWDKDEEKLYFTQIDISETDFSTGEQFVLAEYVKDFSVDLSQVEEKRVVKLSISYGYNNKVYETSNNITIRNKVLVNSINLVVNKSIELSIRVKEKVVVLEPGEDYYKFSTPIVEGKNILDKSVTWSIPDEEQSKLTAGWDTKFTDPANGIIHISEHESAESFKVRVTTNMADSAGNYAWADVLVYVKRAKWINLYKSADSEPSNAPDAISPGCTFTVTANVEGTKLGVTCSKCGNDVEIDRQVVYEGNPYGNPFVWRLADNDPNDSWDPSLYVELLESKPNSSTWRVKPDVPDDETFGFVIQCVSLLSEVGNDCGRHYDYWVTGAISFVVKKPEGGMSPSGGFEYGAEPLTLDFDLQNSTGLICARIKTDNKNAPMSEDKVMIFETEGNNCRVSADLFGLDLNHDYYISLQVLDYPLSKNDPDYAAKRQYLETEYLTHLDATGTYVGTAFRSSSMTTVPLLRPQLSVEYNNKTYEGKEVHAIPISLLQNISFPEVSCKVTAISSTRTEGERTLNAVNADLYFSSDKIYYFDESTKNYVDKLGQGKKGAYIYNKCSINSINQLKIYLDLQNSLSTNYSQEQITQTIKETVGNYYYVPRLAYANGNDAQRFNNKVHYVSPNYVPEYDLKYYLRPESTIYFSITDAGNLKDIWVYTDKEINGSKFANGEIYFPIPSDSSFSNYFTLGNPTLQTKVLWDSFRMKDKDGNIRTIGFSRASCLYILDKNEYEIEFFYNCCDSLWERNVELSAGKFYCSADGTGWSRRSDGDYDNELRNGKKVYEGDGTLKKIWAYTNEEYNGSKFAFGDINFPVPSDDSFKFKPEGTAEKSFNLSGSFGMKDKDGNKRNVVFTRVACKYITTKDEYEIELFYKCYDSLWERDVELSAGRFKCSADGIEWSRLDYGPFDDKLNNGEKVYKGNGTLKSIWVYKDSFVKGDIYFTLPSDSSFSFKTVAEVQSVNLNDEFILKENNGNTRKVKFTRATCEYTKDEYEIELFYEYKDSLWNRDMEVSAGRFRCSTNGTEWSRVSKGALDGKLDNGETNFKSSGTAQINIGGQMVDTMIPLPTSSLFTVPTYNGGLGFDLNIIKNNGSQSVNVGYFALDYMGEYGLAKAQVKDDITCSYDPGTKTYTLEITYWEGWSWENKPMHTIKISCKEGDSSWH